MHGGGACMSPCLIIFAGLPATGKTTLARLLARRLGATYLRIDTIEQALRESRAFAGPMDDVGYRIAYALAADNLRGGQSVVADSVNPVRITREAWRATAKRAGARVVEIEVVCSDVAEHRRRVESRGTDIPGLQLPGWQEVIGREYDPWDEERVVVDTARRSVEEIVARLESVVTG